MADFKKALTVLDELYNAIPVTDEYDLDIICDAGESVRDMVLLDVDVPTADEQGRADLCGTIASKIRAIALARLGLTAECSIDLEDGSVTTAEDAIAQELGFTSVNEWIAAAFAE